MAIFLMSVSIITSAQDDDNGEAQPSPFGAPDPNRPVGLTVNTGEAQEGYILIPMVQSKDTLLLANDGRIVHIWHSDYYPSNSVYLLPNGDLLRTASLDDGQFGFNGQWGFASGRIEKVTWDDDIVWAFEYSNEKTIGHHDIEPMPNGHFLMQAFERFSAEEAIAAGHNPETIPEAGEIFSEHVIEVDPETGEIVWEWRLWDHLIQDFDENVDNYGVVADHPELVDINFLDPAINPQTNWWHVNSVGYNAELDQIILSPRTYSEIWIIDHSVTTEGASGAAGDLLYRWGNPATHRAGTDEDRQLYFQHDPIWIMDGRPGAGDILIFDNGSADRPYSRVLEIAIPTDESGAPIMDTDQPADIIWEYIADPPESFYSSLISGAQRQPNGNTLITEGLHGLIFEVTSDGEIVWEYYLPPAAWAFRAERYTLPTFDDLDMTQDLEFVGGAVWGGDCVDGSQPRLHEYLPQESSNMQLFIDTHGDQAQTQWEMEACAEHGGRVEGE
jgi:hypothetical protein